MTRVDFGLQYATVYTGFKGILPIVLQTPKLLFLVRHRPAKLLTHNFKHPM